MTSRDFIAAEAGNTDRITLYREGLFWKAYERSAFAVCAQVRGFKPTKRALKALGGGELISIGFPTRNETAVLDGLQRLLVEDNRLVLQTPRPIVSKEFEIWKASIPVALDRRPTKEGGARRAASRAVPTEDRSANPDERFEDRCGAHVPAGAAAQRLPESESAVPGGPYGGGVSPAAGSVAAGTGVPATQFPNGGGVSPAVAGGAATRFPSGGGPMPDAATLPPTHPAWGKPASGATAGGAIPGSPYGGGVSPAAGSVAAVAGSPATQFPNGGGVSPAVGSVAVAAGSPATQFPNGGGVSSAVAGGAATWGGGVPASSVAPLPPTCPAGGLSAPSPEEQPVLYGDADFSLAEACRVADAVRRFDLADKTPMECMLFMSELKKMLANC